jgi:multicomponent K+:H+ antiporter subunit G
MIVDALVALLIVAGAVFTTIGSLGLLRMPDVYMRLHGPSKATTIGIGCILLASAIHFGSRDLQLSLYQFLIATFLAITAPVSGHLLAKAARQRRLPGSQPQD